MLAVTSSHELTEWMAFFRLRNAREESRRKEREVLGDDEQVIEW